MARVGWAIAVGAVVVIVGMGFVVATTVLRLGEPAAQPGAETRLERPVPGEIRPDFLADGTPVWVVGHPDGDVGVLSGFDAHRPLNIGKLLWWCPDADAFQNPEHGSKYDAAGRKIGGPAPTGLPSYEVALSGSTVVVGLLGEAPPVGLPHLGPSEQDRSWCLGPEGTLVHSFADWPVHASPQDAVARAPAGWILLAGELAMDRGVVMFCAIGNCSDAVEVVGVEPSPLVPPFPPDMGDRWIARVLDGALVELTRLPPLEP